jgi:hypothetical protein
MESSSIHNGMDLNDSNLKFLTRQTNAIHAYNNLKVKLTNCKANTYFNRQCLSIWNLDVLLTMHHTISVQRKHRYASFIQFIKTLRASTCFEHYLLILRRRFTNET